MRKNEISENIRISAHSECCCRSQHTFKSRTVTRISKAKIYKTTLQPVAMHGHEVWSMTGKDKIRDILRKMYGAIN
jgi:hypothetical protein